MDLLLCKRNEIHLKERRKEKRRERERKKKVRERRKGGRMEEKERHLLHFILEINGFFSTKIFSGVTKEIDITVLDLIFGQKGDHNQ